MRIGIQALGAISSDTGGRTYLVNLSRTLQALDPGHDFVFFTTPGETPLLDLRAPRFHAVEIPASEGGTLHRIFAEQFALPGLIRRHALDAMYFPNNFASFSCPVPYALAIRSMLVYNRTKENSVGFLKTRYRRSLMPHSAQNAAAIITPSPHTKDEIVSYLGAEPGKVHVIPHGIDTALFGATPDPARAAAILKRHDLTVPFIVYVSALWEYKNQTTLILAFEKLIKKNDIPHRLALIGRGMNSYESYAARLHRLVAERGLQDRVRFIDFLPHEELRHVYASADLFAFPSERESFGNAVYEAMAAGLPVVCSDAHGFPAMIGDRALFVPPRDADAWMNAMEKLIRDTKLRNELTDRARTWVQGQTWTRCVTDTLQAIESTITKQP